MDLGLAVRISGDGSQGVRAWLQKRERTDSGPRYWLNENNDGAALAQASALAEQALAKLQGVRAVLPSMNFAKSNVAADVRTSPNSFRHTRCSPTICESWRCKGAPRHVE